MEASSEFFLYPLGHHSASIIPWRTPRRCGCIQPRRSSNEVERLGSDVLLVDDTFEATIALTGLTIDAIDIDNSARSGSHMADTLSMTASTR